MSCVKTPQPSVNNIVSLIFPRRSWKITQIDKYIKKEKLYEKNIYTVVYHPLYVRIVFSERREDITYGICKYSNDDIYKEIELKNIFI